MAFVCFNFTSCLSSVQICVGFLCLLEIIASFDVSTILSESFFVFLSGTKKKTEWHICYVSFFPLHQRTFEPLCSDFSSFGTKLCLHIWSSFDRWHLPCGCWINEFFCASLIVSFEYFQEWRDSGGGGGWWEVSNEKLDQFCTRDDIGQKL